jgi:hypothetical protein
MAVALSKETGYHYEVQMFRRPSSASIQFQVVNHSDATSNYKIGVQTFLLPSGYTRTHQRCRPN